MNDNSSYWDIIITTVTAATTTATATATATAAAATTTTTTTTTSGTRRRGNLGTRSHDINGPSRNDRTSVS